MPWASIILKCAGQPKTWRTVFYALEGTERQIWVKGYMQTWLVQFPCPTGERNMEWKIQRMTFGKVHTHWNLGSPQAYVGAGQPQPHS